MVEGRAFDFSMFSFFLTLLCENCFRAKQAERKHVRASGLVSFSGKL
jgi:hypothetical protein